MPKLYLRTYGCQMNEYDSAKIADVLRAAQGAESTDRPEDADLIVFNTCSVREKAQEKVFADLGRVRHLKRAKPGLMIAVGGCVASQEGAAIVARAPYVDVVFGPQTLHRLPQLLERRRASGTPQVDISFPLIEKFDNLPPPREIGGKAGASAYVTIMEGCSKYCSFCVVPYTRGEEVSRPFADVIAEIAALGVKEVTLLGQNVNAWRGDIDGAAADFAELLTFVCEIPGLERVRYTTSHPREFTQRLIDAHAALPKLAPHVHLPVQSGSDRVLAAMKRGYTALEYRSIIRRLRRARPEVSVTSDFIVGFPGETDADFEATLARARARARRFVLLHLQPAPWHACCRPARRAATRAEAQAPAAPSGRDPVAGRCDRRANGRDAAAGARRRRVQEASRRARRSHRQQPRRQLRGQPRADRS